MALFLFLKQFVDMLYQYQILDYGMVLFAVALLGYKIQKDRVYVNIKEKICIADIMVLLLTVVFGFAFIRNMSFYGVFFKVLSAFLIYFLGRVYGNELIKYGKWLALAGYIVIYANLIYRCYIFGGKLFVSEELIRNGILGTGAFYYYKTDLAIAIIIASIFVYTFSQYRYLKWITIIPVTAYMVFYSDARTGMILLISEYVLICIFELVEKKNNVVISDKIIKTCVIVAFVLIIVAFVIIQTFVKNNTTFQPSVRNEAGEFTLMEKLFHSRHVIWWEVTKYFSEQNFFTRLIGIDLGTEYLHNSTGDRMHSMYFKLLYSVGYIGVLLFAGFIASVLNQLNKCKNGQVIYVTLALLLVFMVMGLTIESLELTQMSWFTMLFSGAAFTAGVGIDE